MKPKVAFFDFASCEGCQLAILNCEDILLDILNLINLVEFREAISETAPRYDIAFVEGSIHRDEDIERIQNLRSRTTYLVALGACACNGNVQARSNFVAPAVNYEVIYGEKARNQVQVDPDYWHLWAHTRVRPLDSIVKVDAYLRGCPVVPEEFLHLVKSLLQGTMPVIPAECRLCGLQEKRKRVRLRAGQNLHGSGDMGRLQQHLRQSGICLRRLPGIASPRQCGCPYRPDAGAQYRRQGYPKPIPAFPGRRTYW